MNPFRFSLIGFCLSFLMGCASATFTPAVKSVGEYKNLTAVAAKAEEMPPKEAEDVHVVIGSIPPGMSFEHGTLTVDPDRYEVLGRVEADLNNPTAANLGLWVYDYAPGEKWRIGYCAWQVPLSWVTFTLWAWIVPLHYPCKAVMGSDEDRTAAIVDTLKRAGKALGADLVVVPSIGGTTVIHAGNHAAVVGSVAATNGSGFAIRTKQPASATPVQPSSTTMLDGDASGMFAQTSYPRQ